MTTGRFHGAFTALVTPFKNGKIDEEAYREFIEWQIEQGIDGLVPCGTTGESATMTHDEHEAAIRICVEQVNKRVPVIAGAGSNNTREAIPLTQFAKNVGADAALHITPYYNKPTQEGLYQHFKTICSEVSMPVILYTVPGRTGCNMLPPTVARIARDVPDVVGIKEATADLIHVSDLVEQCPEGFQILSGDDFTVLPHIAVGGCGVISVTANVAPKLMADLCKATLAGDMDEARRLHFKLMPINRAMFLETNPIPVKTAVCMMRGLDLEFRLPMVPLMPDNLEKLTKDVTIDLYYYLDVKGGEKPDETGNGTPDAWEYRLAFKVVNGEWNNGGNADIVVYVPFKDYKTGEALKYVVVPVTRIPAVGDKPNSGYRAGSWDTTPVGNAKVEKDTVFTYTYARRSSSGGGGGGSSHKPTVTIPDDVPTGLNGDDHYAYIVGYPDSTVRPQNGITRAEVATIFFRLLTDETRNANSTKSNSYSDVAAGAWYNHAVSTLSAMGIVKGDSQGKFNPNAPITRAEFAAIAARFDDKANTTAVDFSDIASHWAKDEISAAANNGWINGYTDGTFRPNNKITRAEAMTLVNRVLKRLPETAKDLHNDMIKWSDNSDTSAWYYLAVQEATNSHYYGIKENKHEKWSKLRETRDWTELEK